MDQLTIQTQIDTLLREIHNAKDSRIIEELRIELAILRNEIVV